MTAVKAVDQQMVNQAAVDQMIVKFNVLLEEITFVPSQPLGQNAGNASASGAVN